MSLRVLLIDDDQRLFELLDSYLAPSDCSLAHAPDGQTGLKMLDAEAFDAVLLDVMGEYGAVQIYRGQKAVFSRIEAKAHAARLISEMEAGEQEHLRTFDRLIAERRVRPTLMAPVWRVAGFGLGAITALMGEEAAHACTEAVEDVIEKHYGHQSDELEGVDSELKYVVDKFREDEIAHKDTAVEQGAHQAPAYPVLSAVIKFGCRAAIRISEKI